MKSLIKPVSLVIVIVIFYFLFKNIFQNGHAIKSQLKSLNLQYLLLSFVILMVSQIYVVFLWMLMVNAGKHRLSLKDAVSIFYLSALGRYVPGKVWQLVGLAYLSEGAGIESEVAITASLLSQSLSVITGIIISAGIIYHYIPYYLFVPVVFVLIVFVYPPVFNKILNIISLKVRKTPLKLSITPVKEFVLIIGYFIAWGIYGFSFYLLFKSIPVNVGYLQATEYFASSYLLGLFAIFVPGGLGVREGILTLLLKQAGVLSYISSFIAIMERISITITEIILGFFGLLVILLKRRS